MRWVLCRKEKQNLGCWPAVFSFTHTSSWRTSQLNYFLKRVQQTASKIPPLRDIDQFHYACYPASAVDIKKEPLESFYPPCQNAVHASRHTQGWSHTTTDLGRENLAQVAALDAEFGLSFYDPYVSEPSLDLSPYLEDIDLDTSQQADIFDLVSSAAPPKQDYKAAQQLGYSSFDNEFEQFLDESGGFMAEFNDAEAFGSQTVPLFGDGDWQSSCSERSLSPALPSDARKLKSRRQRGRKSSANKSNPAGADKGTYEYRLKRERNNVAVRKSRMKTKEKQVAIFRKASELTEENEDLHSVVASLTEELQRLKSFLAKSGISHLDLPIEA